MKSFVKKISVVLATVMTLSIVPSISMAATSNTVLDYKFEKVEIDENAITCGGTKNAKIDDYDHYFIYDGWMRSANGTWPQLSQTAAAAKSGSYGIQITIPNTHRMSIRIPKISDTAETKTYRISVPIKRVSGSSGYVLVATDKEAHDWSSDPANYWPNIPSAKAINLSTNSWYEYKYDMALDASKEHYVCIRPLADMTIGIDDVKVSVIGAPEVESITPADKRAGVSTFVRPVINFDSAISEPSLANITLEGAGETIETTKNVSNGNMTVTLIPVKKLSPFTTYKITVPTTVKGLDGTPISHQTETTFTTGDRNTIFNYDFDEEPVNDLKTEYAIGSTYRVTYERSTEAAESGNYSMKIKTDTGASGSNIYWKLPGGQMANKNHVGRRYVISGDFKCAEGAPNLVLFLSYWANDKSVNRILTDNLRLTNEFQHIAVEFTIKDLTDGEPAAIWDPSLYVLNNAVGSAYYVDNLKLVCTSSIQPEIEKTVPANGSQTSVTDEVNIKFTKTMDRESVLDPSNYSINDKDIEIESVEANEDGTYTLHLSRELKELYNYTVGLNGVLDEDGIALNGQISFKTLASKRVYFDDVKFVRNRGKYEERDITETGLEDGEITIELNGIYNYSEEAQNLRFLTATFEGDKLLSVAIDIASIDADDTTEHNLECVVDVPVDRADNWSIKTFLWTDEQKPVLNATLFEIPEEVHITVAADGTGDFRTITEANASIVDSSAKKRYILDIKPGVYKEINIRPKEYVTFRGEDKDTCIIQGELPDSISSTASGRAQITNSSTINMAATASLENLTVTARNLRYPVHDEASGANPNAVRKIKNCHIEHLGNDGATNNYIRNGYGTNPEDVWQWTTAWGYGTASGVVEEFENTTFKSVNNRAWYVHNNKNFTKPNINVLRNCEMECGTMQDITVESMGSTTNDIVYLENCKFNGYFIRTADHPWINEDPYTQYATRRDFDIILNNCDPLGYKAGNSGKALRITSNSTDSNSKVEVSGSAASDIFGEQTVRLGGGGIKGYTYGKWDVSGALVGLTSDKYVYNTLGRRLNDCTGNNKTLSVKFDGDNSKVVNIVFNENYFSTGNNAIIQKINEAISKYGVADTFSPTIAEYYPTFEDKEFTMVNGSAVGIKRFSAVCVENGELRPMTANDSIDSFRGIALDNIVPGQSGRILTEGYLYNEQLGLDSVGNGDNIKVVENGYTKSGNGATVMHCDNTFGWAYFKAN